MLLSNLVINKDEPIYIQIKRYISNMILKGLIPNNSKLPSTRELSQILKVSRNSVNLAYEELKADGLIYSVSGKGTFAKSNSSLTKSNWCINWEDKQNSYAKVANDMDIIKNEIPLFTSDAVLSCCGCHGSRQPVQTPGGSRRSAGAVLSCRYLRQLR